MLAAGYLPPRTDWFFAEVEGTLLFSASPVSVLFRPHCATPFPPAHDPPLSSQPRSGVLKMEKAVALVSRSSELLNHWRIATNDLQLPEG